jgi:hypothetical protein
MELLQLLAGGGGGAGQSTRCAGSEWVLEVQVSAQTWVWNKFRNLFYWRWWRWCWFDNSTGGAGGSGIVVVRYQIASLTATAKATGGLISFFGGKTIHTFMSSGDFVYLAVVPAS